MPLTVVLDTNFLTVPAQFGVDIFAEAERVLERRVEFVVLDSVVQELRQNGDASRGQKRTEFKIALALVDRCRVVNHDFKEGSPVDDQLLQYTEYVRGVLATNDRELRDRALKMNVPVLILRARKHLELLGSLF